MPATTVKRSPIPTLTPSRQPLPCPSDLLRTCRPAGRRRDVTALLGKGDKDPVDWDGHS